MIAVIDSGGANLTSVIGAFQRLQVEAELTNDPKKIRKAQKVILPGVGAAADAMARLNSNGLVSVICSLTQPVLGICLGMQLLYQFSSEGESSCLGVIPGRVEKLNPSRSDQKSLTIPHMGWNQVEYSKPSPLFEGITNGCYFYFVHSYCAPLDSHVIAQCNYGGNFPAAVQYKNFFGVQFHPERSSLAGAKLLQNFLGL